MIAPLLLLAAAPPPLDFDMRDFGENSVVYAPPVMAQSASTIAWPKGTRLQLDDRGDELVVRFDRPVDEASVARFEAEAARHVQSLRWNDDSLLLRANPGVRLSSRVAGQRLIVTFATDHGDAPAPPTAGQPVDEERDLAMVAIRADLASGFAGKARRQAEALAQRHPEDKDVRRLLADVLASDGEHRAAAEHYRAAGANDMSARRAMALAPGQAALGMTLRDGTGFTQIEGSARATVTASDTVALTGAVRHVVTQADAAVVRDALAYDIDENATLADIGVTVDLAPRLRVDLVGGVWLDRRVAGGGARLAYGSSDTQLRIGYVHHMPDLSFAEQAVDRGTLSQLTLGGSAQLLPEMRGRIDGGWRRYGLAGIDNAAETLTLAGQIDYILLRRPVLVSLGYRLDAEYVQRLSYNATGLQRLPLSDRENHTVQAFASGAIGPVLMTGGAGWTVDRYGGSGPNASLAASAPMGVRWQLDAAMGLTSITRPGFPGKQVFGRVELRRALGDGT